MQQKVWSGTSNSLSLPILVVNNQAKFACIWLLMPSSWKTESEWFAYPVLIHSILSYHCWHLHISLAIGSLETHKAKVTLIASESMYLIACLLAFMFNTAAINTGESIVYVLHIICFWFHFRWNWIVSGLPTRARSTKIILGAKSLDDRPEVKMWKKWLYCCFGKDESRRPEALEP